MIEIGVIGAGIRKVYLKFPTISFLGQFSLPYLIFEILYELLFCYFDAIIIVMFTLIGVDELSRITL